MNTNLFALASGLSDSDLLVRIVALAGKERETSAELVAHLAALDARPSLYAAEGHGSLFSYCTRVLFGPRGPLDGEAWDVRTDRRG